MDSVIFLGTGAASSYPLPFCHCDNCTKAQKLGGPSLRKRSSLLINKDLLIDPGPDIMSASFAHGCSIANIRYCLITHTHSDHFDASHIITRIPAYAGIGISHLDLFASPNSMKEASNLLGDQERDMSLFTEEGVRNLNITIHQVEPLNTFEAGKYSITPFTADHDNRLGSLMYGVDDGTHSVFYGTDADTFPEETWEGLKSGNFQFDVVILDHTYGPGVNSGSHLNAEKFVEHYKRMKNEGLLKNNARIIATHISHEGNPVHPELVKYAEQNGYEVAYDGLKLEF